MAVQLMQSVPKIIIPKHKKVITIDTTLNPYVFSEHVDNRMDVHKDKKVSLQKLRYNCEQIVKYCKAQNQDWIFLITGGEGTGKSTIGRHLAEILDPEFDMLSQMVYSFNEEYSYLDFIQNFRDKPYRSVLFDEAVTTLFARNHSSGTVVDAVKIFNMNRQLNHFSILIVPSFWGIDIDIRERRARTMLYVFQDELTFKRKYAYYSRRKIPNISNSDVARKLFASPSAFINLVKPNYVESFPKLGRRKEDTYIGLKADHFTTLIDKLDAKYQKGKRRLKVDEL